ncbi:MAG: class I SAM-dependent methyltransferase [Desulfomonile tiedjei]|nr:class I SAM-dependent methyltransferase [Desulfomonile tiedjei]
MLKAFVKKLLRKAADAAGLNASSTLRELEASRRNLEAIAIGIANIEMKLQQLGIDQPQTPRSVLSSSLCKQSDFFSEEFRSWMKRIAEPIEWNRKLWEYYFIAQALYERGFLSPGRRGLGFGVGDEPLASLFATFECRIVATDLAPSDPGAAHWIATGQHATGLPQLWKAFCPQDKFNELVTFHFSDMRNVPEDLRGFDFLWSCCSLEHLGSIEHGKQFVLDAMKCLKPGGVALHTTEFCLNSDDATVEQDDLVFYRKRDILDLQERLLAEGNSVAPIIFDRGNGVLDHFVGHPPSGARAHLRFELLGFTATAIGLIITRNG